eukprot:g9776.t1
MICCCSINNVKYIVWWRGWSKLATTLAKNNVSGNTPKDDAIPLHSNQRAMALLHDRCPALVITGLRPLGRTHTRWRGWSKLATTLAKNNVSGNTPKDDAIPLHSNQRAMALLHDRCPALVITGESCIVHKPRGAEIVGLIRSFCKNIRKNRSLLQVPKKKKRGFHSTFPYAF